MKVLPVCATLLAAMLVGGCARAKPASARTPSSAAPAATSPDSASGSHDLIITPVEGLQGKVSSVNTTLRFVVLTFPVGQMAAVNQKLNVYRNGLKVAELRVTGPQQDESIVADITAGEAVVGDEVRSD